MNFPNRIRTVFERKNPDMIPWMPRIEHWYNVNRARGTLPSEFRELELIDVYKNVNAFMRMYVFVDELYGMFNLPLPVRTTYEDVEIKIKEEAPYIHTEVSTPLGTLNFTQKGWNMGFQDISRDIQLKR